MCRFGSVVSAFCQGVRNACTNDIVIGHSHGGLCISHVVYLGGVDTDALHMCFVLHLVHVKSKRRPSQLLSDIEQVIPRHAALYQVRDIEVRVKSNAPSRDAANTCMLPRVMSSVHSSAHIICDVAAAAAAGTQYGLRAVLGIQPLAGSSKYSYLYAPMRPVDGALVVSAPRATVAHRARRNSKQLAWASPHGIPLTEHPSMLPSHF